MASTLLQKRSFTKFCKESNLEEQLSSTDEDCHHANKKFKLNKDALPGNITREHSIAGTDASIDEKELKACPSWYWMPSKPEILEQLFPASEFSLSSNLAVESVYSQNFCILPFERNFLYNESYQWNWHKNWIIPEICVMTKQSSQLPPASSDLRVQLKVIKYKIINNDVPVIEEVLSKGDKMKNFTLGSATFSNIKFGTTSYLNDGMRFNLMITVTSAKLDVNDKEKVLYSMISPPIFVNCNNQLVSAKFKRKENSMFSLFDPVALSKAYIRKDKTDGENEEQTITSNLKGLYNYLSAINIKNKVKHPLFILFRFNQCAQLFFNPKHLKENGSEEKSIIYTMNEELKSCKVSKTKEDKNFRLSEDMPFILFINLPQSNLTMTYAKVVLGFLKEMKQDRFGVCINADLIPKNYKSANISKLRTTYEELYPTLESELIAGIINKSHSNMKSEDLSTDYSQASIKTSAHKVQKIHNCNDQKEKYQKLPVNCSKQQIDQPKHQFETPLKHVEPRQQFEQPRLQFEQPRLQFEQPRQQFEQPRQQFEQPRQQFEQPRLQFELPRLQFEQPREQFEQPRLQFELPRLQFEQPREQFEQPRLQFELPRMQFEQPREQIPNLVPNLFSALPQKDLFPRPNINCDPLCLPSSLNLNFPLDPQAVLSNNYAQQLLQQLIPSQNPEITLINNLIDILQARLTQPKVLPPDVWGNILQANKFTNN